MSEALQRVEVDDRQTSAAAGPEGQGAAVVNTEEPQDSAGVHIQRLHDTALSEQALPRSLTEQLMQDIQETGKLHIDMLPDEDEWMMDIGLLNSCCGSLHTADIAVSQRVSAMAAAENVKMLFVFNSLRSLQLRFDFARIEISQRLVCAVAELLHLTCLHILHGSMSAEVDIAHWSSLRNLAELKLLPAESSGLGDAQLEQLTLLSTNLTHLSIRACPSTATSTGRWHLGSLPSLQELSCCPIGKHPTYEDLQRMVDMPQLKQLTLGLKHASEVLLFSSVQLPAKQPSISLQVLDAAPTLSATDVLSVTSWCLSHHLVSLAVGPLSCASPGDVLVMLQTLKQLRELKLQLSAPADEHSSGTVDLLTLTPLVHLTSLELLTSSRLYVPLTVKTISLASLAWPRLSVLRLSLSGKPELMPEALALCDNFRGLTELQLFSPPDDLTPTTASNHLPVSTSSSDGNCLFPGHLTGSGSWVHWAASGLGSLGRSALGSTGRPSNSSSGNGTHAGLLGVSGRSSSLPVHWTPDAGGVLSPLARDARQHSLVKQQQQQVREQWQQHQLLEMDRLPEQSKSLVYGEQQELPAAVDAFQRYKVKSPRRQYSADSSAGSTMPRKHAGVHSTPSTLDSQASGSWPPVWILQKFASLGSPAAAAAGGRGAAGGDAFTAAADAAVAAAGSSSGGAGVLHRSVSDTSSPKGAWTGRIMAACSGSSYRHTYSGSTNFSLQQQQHSTPAYPTPFHSAAAAAAAAFDEVTSQQQQQQQRRQGGGLAAPAAPGCELTMYRASSGMIPLVLNYLPDSLRKLCLESFHLIVVGLPGKSGHSTQQQQQVCSLGHRGQAAEAAAAADAAYSNFDAAAAAGLAATAALEALTAAAAAKQAPAAEQKSMHPLPEAEAEDKQAAKVAAATTMTTGQCASQSPAHPVATQGHVAEAAADTSATTSQETVAATAAAAAGPDAASVPYPVAASNTAAMIVTSNTASSTSNSVCKPISGSCSRSMADLDQEKNDFTTSAIIRSSSSRHRCLPLQNLRHLELEECCVDDASMHAVLQAATGLRTLELAGLEGLTDAGLAALTQLKHITRFVMEAEHTTGITLRAFDVISQLTTLKKLHWCSRDSMHGPLDIDALTEQLCALTGLRQLVLLTHQQELLTAMSGWKIVLHRRLPLCRLVLWRELVAHEPWGDVPDEDAQM